ncbi:hypothetical protein FHU10_4482 [Serratia fonticola]|jgi:preprotein translocase subunit SecD|uniref:Fimbrial protein n=1 Tax=Serratia fonticola TaxID=47917 RepID=A0A542BPZ2_SERFO|nr:hypothetical protein [Serratia fonticola]TQI80643.1 hypothetical protein FHU09_3221 [Serratia fonticola]TQI97332.1 hypothetical protein FHU11_2823 [Serratia fonticola]TVZ71828.1 hypothetical protein FHU10_4482 [Serratia fonticola]
MRLFFLILVLFPATSFAMLKDLSATIGNESLQIPASCIESINSEVEGQPINSGIRITLKTPCSKQLSDFTAKNIGHNLTISYGGAVFQTAIIVSRIPAHFRMAITSSNQVIARQIIEDTQQR